MLAAIYVLESCLVVSSSMKKSTPPNPLPKMEAFLRTDGSKHPRCTT
jgi:uncharacterized lipoprotein YajG